MSSQQQNELRIELPEPHAGQRQVLDEAKRFNVGCMGRRFGKTQFCLGRVIASERSVLEGYPWGWFAPEYKFLMDPWTEAVRLLGPLITRKNYQEKRIELVTGGLIDFWTLDNSDAGRGRKYAGVIIDEAAMVRHLQPAWTQSIRPTLTDFEGEAWFMSTPKGMNYFSELYRKGQDEDEPNWMSWQMPTTANPHINAEEIDMASFDMPELDFRQEYLAEFVEMSGTAIKRDWIQHRAIEPTEIVMGVDLAISTKETADYTAIVVLGRNKDGEIVILDVQRDRLPFHRVIEFVKRMAASHKPRLTVIEEVQYQAAVVQELLRTTKLNIRGVKPDRDKFVRFAPLQVRYEQGLVSHSPDLPAYFEQELLSFPLGQHDDCVDAAVMAFNGLAEFIDFSQFASGRRRDCYDNSPDLTVHDYGGGYASLGGSYDLRGFRSGV